MKQTKMHNLSTQYKNVLCDTVVMEPDPIMPQFCAFFNASRVTDVCPHYCTIPYTCNVWSFFSRIELDTCQANYLLFYEQICLTEGTDLLVEAKTVESLKKTTLNCQIQTATSYSTFLQWIISACKKLSWFRSFWCKHKG